MLAAETNHRKEEALAQARKAVERLDTLLALGGLSAAQLETASEYLYQIAVTHKNLHRFDEAIEYSRRCVELSRGQEGGALRVGLGLSLLADLYRVTGDMDRALETITDARNHLERAAFPNDTARRSSWIALLWREGKILGSAHGLGLNRTSDAIRVLEEAFDLIEEWCQNDAQGAISRLFFVSVGRELGELLRVHHPGRALVVYDHSVRRLSTVENNAEARRGQAVLLAGSAYPLRALGRSGEAGRRIDAAFRVLAESRQDATSRTSRNTAVESLLRARADHLADIGQPRRAVEIYEELLGRLEAAKLDPRHDLRDAVAVSETYASLAALYRRGSTPENADALDARRVSLWREWESRLPKNSVAREQLKFVRAR
jgi:tetratricopeptide (TPR) repeat protein